MEGQQKQPALRHLVMDVDEDDHRAIQKAITEYQRTRRWHDAQGGVMVPEGESDVCGAIIAEICRGWMDAYCSGKE